jgi:hypothetical protein
LHTIDEDDYQPSAALLAAMSSLPPDYLETGAGSGKQPAHSGPSGPQVKTEPLDGVSFWGFIYQKLIFAL